MNVKPIIKPRRNSRMDSGPLERCSSVMILKTLEGWSRVMCYGRRWAAETSFSTFKRLYGNTAWLEAWRT
jgi:hypothetical protein